MAYNPHQKTDMDSSAPPIIVAQAYAVQSTDTNFSASAPAAPGNANAPVPNQAQQQFLINEGGVREFLSQYHWPVGLQEVLIKSLHKIPIRFFICDDSGSMTSSDGKKLVGTPPNQKVISCTRWSELTTALNFHVNLAHSSCAKTEFRLLNGAEPLTVGDINNQEQSAANVQTLSAIFANSPSGGTPLCYHIGEVIKKITPIADQLKANGQKACVIIATDGESSDGNIAEAMRQLRNLPVWVVIRLCTDEDKIVDYWNNIDNELELDMDVLDDLASEAAEINKLNPFMTYGEPIHRLREFGVAMKEVDLLDEVALTPDQIRNFCAFMFGGKPDDYPHPDADWHGFETAIKHELSKVPKVWNPLTKTPSPWINTSRIKRSGGGMCSIQ